MSLTIALGPSDTLVVEWPSHRIAVPINEDGLGVLRRILIAQRDDSAHRTIGFDQLPTQWLVEKWLKENTPKGPSIAGLDLSEIEL